MDCGSHRKEYPHPDRRPRSFCLAIPDRSIVRVVANQRSGVYSTHAIDVVAEVVGDVDSVSGNHLIVLGQTVSTANLAKSHHWTPGDHIAVSGLRRPDGMIIASLIERRSNTPDQVAGPIVQASDGSLKSVI